MNNSVFGKTMENLRERINIESISNAKVCVKSVSRPNFVSQKIFSKHFVAIHKIKPVLTLNRPIYVGFSILDLGKLLRYEFHYKYIESKSDGKLLLTDTDSLIYEIKAEDVYEDFYLDKDLFGFSDYLVKSKFCDLKNKKIIGKIKDELKRKIIDEFVGLKSKMYSLFTINDKKSYKSKMDK